MATRKVKLNLKKLYWSGILLTAFVICSIWTSYPALRVTWAAFNLTIPTYSMDEWEASEITSEIRRIVQNHFLKHKIYIPHEDITIVTDQIYDDNMRLSALTERACGLGQVFVWMPVAFKLPIVGHKVYEWCWKPKVKIILPSTQ